MFGRFVFKPAGSHQSTTVAGTALTLTVPGGNVDAVALQALAQNIRYTIDGTTPTASTGFQLTAGSSDVVGLSDGVTVKVIAETGTANIEYQALILADGGS